MLSFRYTYHMLFLFQVKNLKPNLFHGHIRHILRRKINFFLKQTEYAQTLLEFSDIIIIL
jgi:hypothetical protein